MNLKTHRGASLGLLVAITLMAVAAVYGARPAATQDVIGLERRISLVEQRLTSIEMRINRLEQQSRLPPPAAPTTTRLRDTELELLRSEVELLQRRVAEDECGLVKLDERTLSQVSRDERRKGAVGREDPCRLNTDAPLRLSSRR